MMADYDLTDSGWQRNRFNQLLNSLLESETEFVVDFINGPHACQEAIYNPVPQTIAGRNTFTIKISAPIIQRTGNQVVVRVGLNVDTAQTQALVMATVQANEEIAGLAVYSHNAISIASNVMGHQGTIPKMKLETSSVMSTRLSIK